MSVNLRYPNITALSEKEQLTQIKSYLHQLVEQLNYALLTIGGTASTGGYEAQGGSISYYELQSMIVRATNEMKTEYEKLYERLETDYVGKEAFDAIVADLETGFTDFQTQTNEAIQKLQTDLQALDALIESLGADSKDYVSEIGNVNGWTYKKWFSGTYEMFGAFTVTTTMICTDMGSMFCSEEFSLPTPFAIENAVISGSADDLFMVTSGNRAGVDADTNISFVLLRPFSFDAGMDIHVRLHVTGTCNIGGIE